MSEAETLIYFNNTNKQHMPRPRLVQRVSERVNADAVVSAIENTKAKYSEIFNELIMPIAQKYMADGVPFGTAVKFAKKELTLFAV